jgi:hypothetical protein
MLRSRLAGQDENACADDCADAKRDEVQRSENALQTMLAGLLCFVEKSIERFCRKDIAHAEYLRDMVMTTKGRTLLISDIFAEEAREKSPVAVIRQILF